LFVIRSVINLVAKQNAENVNRQSKNNLINDDNDNMDSHTHFMEQTFNKPYPSMEYKCITTKEIVSYRF